jgi:ABC-type bacteriocin/lantibiotic exporter with double-glycine peptidase domain
MSPIPVTEDYYKVLGVEQTASIEVIVKSYKQLALKLHPDRNKQQDATERFQLVWLSPSVRKTWLLTFEHEKSSGERMRL